MPLALAERQPFGPPTTQPTPTTNMTPPITPLPDFSRGNNGLLPVIAQDADDGTVLMLAWMNEEAWQATLASGRATYFSRSRNTLWRKGDTSGHRQQVVEACVDCDADAILLKVQQTGAACHENYRSCFFRTVSASGEIAVNQEKLPE